MVYMLRVLVLSLALALLAHPVLAEEVQSTEAVGPLIVYGEDWYIRPDSEAQAKQMGEITVRVKAFMDRTGIPYEMRFPPRPRKGVLLQRHAKGLYLEYLRTPARENQYHWILPIRTDYSLRVYTLRTNRAAGVKIEDLKAGGFVGACEFQAIGCEVMETLGIDSAHTVAMPLTATTGLERLLLAGRADFVVSTEMIFDRNMANLGVAAEDTVSLGEVARYSGYLIAPKNLDPDLLDILMKTSQEGLPSVN
ncbi:hypothetical protein [Gimibacter soli]|uniref:Solute-binding protein family 3/N-terminal domain-containing protein n=1 Tax=Gimibacter soli TaxID=3024400 RepID=A0AAE9XRK1_9PROT|nr:hypothetical protein [Gimibacter soli]WCL53901.1 hypothetical protein PH603_15290 [Gimibacter soli]